MSAIKRTFEILEAVNNLGESTRMDVFQSFDGLKNWSFVKRSLGFLAAEKLIESRPNELPGKGRLWKTTKSGKEFLDQLFSEEITEEVPRR